MPKKPKGAIQLFLQEKLKDLKKVYPSIEWNSSGGFRLLGLTQAKPDLKGPDLKNEVREAWWLGLELSPQGIKSTAWHVSKEILQGGGKEGLSG